MKHVAVDGFWEAYGTLPIKIRKYVDNNFAIIKQNTTHPLLRLMNVEDMWSMRVDSRHRALAIQHDDTMIWFWVGTYSKYKQLFL